MTTTTIIPTAAMRIDYTATLLSPLHHGAGNAGNTQILRTREYIQPDRTVARAPFVSAASIRHALRDRLAWHLAAHTGITPGSLTKLGVDLLWTGGAVTTTGAETDLDLMRRVREHLPILSLLGFAAKSDIFTGTLRASDLELECAETAHALGLPDGLPRAAAFRSEEFGTRHDQANSPAVQYVEMASDLVGAPVKTTQMIWDTQVITTGAVMRGHMTLTPGSTDADRMVLGAALALWAPAGEAHIGAKTASGYGHVRIDGLGDHTAALDAWTAHLTSHAEPIRGLIDELTR